MKKEIETNDVEKINAAKDKLLEKANELSKRVYEEAAKANQNKEDTSSNDDEDKDNDDDKKDDDVIDAEFEEK